MENLAAIILDQSRALQGIPKTERELKAEKGKVWSRLFFASLLLSLIFISGLVYRLLRLRKSPPSESVMAVTLLCLGIVCGLTVIGIWFRGPGMALGFFFLKG